MNGRRFAEVPSYYAKRIRDPGAFRVLCAGLEEGIARYASPRPDLTPMEILGLELEAHVEALVAAAKLSSPLPSEVDNAEITAVALTNALGKFLFTGVKSSAQVEKRIHLINERLLLWAEAELKGPQS